MKLADIIENKVICGNEFDWLGFSRLPIEQQRKDIPKLVYRLVWVR